MVILISLLELGLKQYFITSMVVITLTSITLPCDLWTYFHPANSRTFRHWGYPKKTFYPFLPYPFNLTPVFSTVTSHYFHSFKSLHSSLHTTGCYLLYAISPFSFPTSSSLNSYLHFFCLLLFLVYFLNYLSQYVCSLQSVGM